MLEEVTSPITPIGKTNGRGLVKKFGIKLDDRRRHVYVIGKTGVGKTTLLENMAIADMQSGKGLAIIDPHGEFAEKLLNFVPENRLDDVIYFDPSDMANPIAFNPMEQVGSEFRHLVASGIMGVFKKIWPDAWSARMEYILNNTLLALLEYPGSTLLSILRVFAEPAYRKKIVDNLKDPVIKAFWQNEFARYTQRLETEALAAIQNKVGQFVSNPLIRNILGQSRSALNMRDIMDSGKIFIANLSKGKMGEDNSALLGAMIITRLQLAAMSRVDIPEEKRRDFFMYVDEFQNFATESFASILSEARKYRLSLVLAHQYIGQLVSSDQNTKVRDAVFGNVGTIVTFRIGAADAEFLEKEFMPEFTEQDLVNLSKAQIYTKLMIDGVASRPFSAETLAPQKIPLTTLHDVIIKNSQEKYGTPRAIVEQKIAGEWAATSEDIIEEKMGRGGERRLNEVLRPGGGGRPQTQSSRPRFDAPRNDNRPPYSSSSAPRQLSPRDDRADRPAQSVPREKTFSEVPYSAPRSSPTVPPIRPRIVQPRMEDLRHPSPEPVDFRQYDTEDDSPAPTKPINEIVARKDQSDETPFSSRAPSSTPATPGRNLPEPRRETRPNASPNLSEQRPAPVKPKQFPKPNVNIDELRRAINESLKDTGDKG